MNRTFPTFAQFFTAITGNQPFPWQEQLAEFAAAHRRFPDAITVPTGLGKTASMVAHTWALADDVARNGTAGRTYPMRFFHIVERRVVVDSAYDTAVAVADKLQAAEHDDPVLGPVAAALRSLIPEPMRDFEPLVATAALHGGRRRDSSSWLRPVGAALVCATVTQIASRFAFRGVGVSQIMMPMHAAVVGMDAVIAVDEPHLSVPAVVAMRDGTVVQRDGVLFGGDRPVPEPTVPVSQVVLLGATPPPGVPVSSMVGADAADTEHPVAGKRMCAARRLVVRQVAGADTDSKLVNALVKAAIDAAERDVARGETVGGGTDGVLVFCNTVAMAQAVYQGAVKAAKPRSKWIAAPVLIHGKMRTVDRQLDALGRGVITVTTQALEVGADFDGFEVITQPCDTSALIQRAGRCNRRGEMADAAVVMIVGEKRSKDTGEEPDNGAETKPHNGTQIHLDNGTKTVYPDPHGAADVLAAAKRLGGGDAAVPFGPADLPAFVAAVREIAGCEEPQPRCARLHSQMSSYLAHTDPLSPFPVDALLRGLDERRSVEVRIAWRRDNDLELLADVPPMDGETLTVPISALRELLNRAGGGKANEVVVEDTDTGPATRAVTAASDGDTGEKKAQLTAEQLALVRVTSDQRTWVTPESIRDISPGSTVVLASSLGGYGPHGLDLASRDSVSDIANKVALAAGHGAFVADDGLHAALTSAVNETGADVRRLNAAAAEMLGMPDNAGVQAMLVLVGDGRQRFVIRLGAPATDIDSPWRCATLGEHGHQVGTWTAAAAATLPLPQPLRDELAAAGFDHDAGKADPRFQRSIGAAEASGSVAFAKSRRWMSREQKDEMRMQAGLPSGWRHEVASVGDQHGDLVAHLIVSHHRHGRGLITHVDDDAQRLGDPRISSHAEVFDALNDRFGPWGLALLETVMRWCDHRASAHPWTARRAAASGAQVRPVAAAPLPTPTRFADADPPEIVRLPGLSASPQAGPLAAVGLLATLERTGVLARLRFHPIDECVGVGGEPGIGDAVKAARRDVTVWERIDNRLKALGVNTGLRIKGGKVPVSIVSADLVDGDLLRQLLPDGGVTFGGDRQMLVSLGFPNNGSAFSAASLDVGTEAFFDTSAGYVSVDDSGVRDSGVDSSIIDLPRQVVRPGVLAWAMDGHLVLGWWPGVAGVTGRTLVLPTPTRWTTVAGYRALVRGRADGPCRQWVMSAGADSAKQRAWERVGVSRK